MPLSKQNLRILVKFVFAKVKMEVSPWQDRVSKRLCLVQVTLDSISCTIFWFPIWIRLIQCWRKLWSQMQFNMDVSLVWYITTEMILLGPNNSFSHACLEYSILMLGFGVFDYASMMHHSLMYTDEIVISVSKSCKKRIIVEWVLRSQLCLCNSNVLTWHIVRDTSKVCFIDCL